MDINPDFPTQPNPFKANLPQGTQGFTGLDLKNYQQDYPPNRNCLNLAAVFKENLSFQERRGEEDISNSAEIMHRLYRNHFSPSSRPYPVKPCGKNIALMATAVYPDSDFSVSSINQW